MTIQIKAIEQYFHVVWFIVLYKVVLIFKSVNETPVCDHSPNISQAVPLCGTVWYVGQCGSYFLGPY